MFPYRSCLHCRVFAPAAPRRAWIRVSESISGLLLPQPVLITGLTVHYTGNNLISRRPIQPPRVSAKQHSSKNDLSGIIPSFPGVIPDHWVGYPRVTEQSAEVLHLTTRMA